MLENIFLSIVKMSATASITAVAVILFRQLAGRKLPRIFSNAAWIIVLIRLLVPFSIQSRFSIFNIVESPNTAIDRAVGTVQLEDRITPHDTPEGKSNSYDIDTSETGFSANEKTHFNSYLINEEKHISAEENTRIDEIHPHVRTTPIPMIACIWLSVTIALLGLGIYAYIRTTRKLKTAVLFDDKGLVEECGKNLNLNRKVKVFVADMVDTPFVAGLARVRIMLPASFVQKCDDRDLKYVITHELVHIKRLDYVTKILAVLALSIHWFNPLIWLCFLLFQKDMEMSCDASVLSAHKGDIRSEYAKSLLNIAAKQNALFHGGLLAFGESNIRSRIKGIMSYKKNRAWIGVIAALLLIVIGCFLLTNGKTLDTGKSMSAAKDKALSNLLEHRTRYIGDAVNAGSLLNKLPYGNSKRIELATDSKPYGITINYRLEDIEASDKDTINNVKSVLQDNALILFSLIENVDTVKFKILPINMEVQFERSEMQQYFDRQLWEYSNDKESYEEFLLDICFKIYTFPEKYTMAMSSVPGLRIAVSLNTAFYDAGYSKRCSTDNGSLFTWGRSTGKITDHGKSLDSALGEPIYWSPVGMEEAVRESTVTISIIDTDGNMINEKRIRIEKVDAHSYGVSPSYDIITESYPGIIEGGYTGNIIHENITEGNITRESDGANKQTEHIVSMEEVLDDADFQYMTGEQIESILRTLPEIIRDNYHGIGRIENNGSGYILLTCKSDAERIPEDTVCYRIYSDDSGLEQLVLKDADENEICSFPLGLEVIYYKDYDIFYIETGEASKNTSKIKRLSSYLFSGNEDFLEYAKQAKMRGTSLFRPEEGSYICADIWFDGRLYNEYIIIDESFADEIESRLSSIEKTHCDFSSVDVREIGVHMKLENRNNYSLCIFADDGTTAIHRWSDRNAVLIDPKTHDMIVNFVMERTPWEWKGNIQR